MTKVKICGITNLEDALEATELGADMLGFNFYPGSKRYIDKRDAESIVERLNTPITKVGVFVNQAIEVILETERIAELGILQLHGDESSEFISKLRAQTDAKIIKAFRVGPDFDPSAVKEYEVEAILLDSYSVSERGGTGERFDWGIAKDVCATVNSLYLAGGISVENVREAIREVQPYAVDVCSSVESTPGKKDKNKLRAFFAEMKGNG